MGLGSKRTPAVKRATPAPHTSPKTETSAFFIRAYAEERGWDVTIPELAKHIGRSVYHVNNVLRAKDWLDRIRKVAEPDYHAAIQYLPVGEPAGILCEPIYDRDAERQAVSSLAIDRKFQE